MSYKVVLATPFKLSIEKLKKRYRHVKEDVTKRELEGLLDELNREIEKQKEEAEQENNKKASS